MLLDEFLELLEGVKPAGNGYVGVCPAHDDREASLGVTEGDEALLVKCHAGCDTESVLTEMGLKFSDLFINGRSSTNKSQEPEFIYNYTDEAGGELYQVLRFPGKKFRQRHQDPENEKADSEGWVWNLEDVRRVPYHLAEVLEAVAVGTTIYIVEGEKDAENLRAAGKVTTTLGAAGKWRPEFVPFFVGASTVVIVADRDEPGRNNAETIRAALEPVVGNAWVVESRSGKDATDHLEAGFSVEQFKVIRKQRRGIVTASELATHARERLSMTPDDLPGYQLCPEIPLVFRQGRMYAVGAYTGDGKTCFALQGLREIAATGKRVGYFSLEMPEIDLANRLAAHKGVPLIFTEEPWRLRDRPDLAGTYEQALVEIESWGSEIILDSNATAESIRDKAIDREYDVVFVDHLHRFSWKDRGALDAQVKGLTNIALELNCLVVVLCQLRKTQRGQGFDTYPRPSLQDFRETSQIGDDASMALAVWRQRDGSGLKYTGPTEVIVLKNRHTTGAENAAGKSFWPHFDPQRQLFVPKPATEIPMTSGGQT